MSVDLRKRRRRPGSFEYVSENSWIMTDQNNIPPPPVINSTSWIGEYVRLTTGTTIILIIALVVFILF